MLRLQYAIKHFAQDPGYFNLCLLKAFSIMNWKVKELIHLLVSISAYRTKQAGQHTL